MPNKKKILFVNNNLDTGGVQRSLVNLLNLISNKYDVTLFVFSNSGEYKDCLTPAVNVIEASSMLNLLGISQKQAKTKGLLLYCLRAMLVIYTKIINNQLPINLLVSTQKKMIGFDTSISFLHNCTENILYGGCNDFVLNRVEATQKISFIHCDFMKYGGNILKTRMMYEHFDKIAAVSEGCKKSFLKALPNLEERAHCVYNCNNYVDYRTLATENPIEYPQDSLNIVTVARLSDEKGIIRGIESLHKLNMNNYKIRWHIIGDGPQKNQIEEMIENLRLTDHIILYGNQKNPYRYIMNSDALLITSFHEAAPMVIYEAKSLGIPVITTNTISAEEMVLENSEGFVCENSEEGIYLILKYILDNPSKLNGCKEYLSGQIYNNEEALVQFYSLID